MQERLYSASKRDLWGLVKKRGQQELGLQGSRRIFAGAPKGDSLDTMSCGTHIASPRDNENINHGLNRAPSLSAPGLSDATVCTGPQAMCSSSHSPLCSSCSPPHHDAPPHAATAYSPLDLGSYAVQAFLQGSTVALPQYGSLSDPKDTAISQLPKVTAEMADKAMQQLIGSPGLLGHSKMATLQTGPPPRNPTTYCKGVIFPKVGHPGSLTPAIGLEACRLREVHLGMLVQQVPVHLHRDRIGWARLGLVYALPAVALSDCGSTTRRRRRCCLNTII